MKRLEFNENQKLADVLRAISEELDKEIEIFVQPGSDILKISTNIEVIGSLAESLGKKVVIKGDFEEVPKEPATKEKGENLGFVEGKDVATQEEVPVKKTRLPSFLKLPQLRFPKGRKRIYIAAGTLVASVVIMFSVVWFVPKANVTLMAETQFKEAELSLIASSSSEEVDIDKGIIPLKVLETTQEDVLEAKATGTKTVGTQAEGRVKIVNRETSSKKFFAGTKIKTLTGGSLNFTLDNSATVSAAPLGCTNNCPEAAVNVTATAIGEKSNLPAGTKFQVGSVTDTTKVVAESLTNFTGGSSKKLVVVSSEDQKKAKEELLKKLEEAAIEELEKENPGIIVPDGGLEAEVLNEVYSRKVGEEANNFRLSLQVKFTAKVFSEEDLKDLLIDSISSTIPDDFTISRENSSVESEILEGKTDDLKIIGKIKASLIPDLDMNKVKAKIVGKDFSSTDQYLKSLNSISGFEIKISPSLFRLFGVMPFSKNRIEIELVQES